MKIKNGIHGNVIVGVSAQEEWQPVQDAGETLKMLNFFMEMMIIKENHEPR